ncbi:hypothetical protein KSP40_PGU013543 [Platanthera guangdongensis]|uniref:PSP proline-rich domain-containing protein n=1 Tax=Platanthera guangdongensis TaxID=2320717 RepID=A0ABR2MH49_9ASPA
MGVSESDTVAAAPSANGGVIKAGPLSNGGSEASKKKARESDRRRRRRKQKKKSGNNPSAQTDGEESEGGTGDDEKENAYPKPEIDFSVEVEYVPEKADLDDNFLQDFKSVFEKLSFRDSDTGSDDVKMDELAANVESKKKDSDSDEELDSPEKDKGGLSNKKKKLQRRMKIAELKQICTRPDVVEVWDATAADPKLLVFLKSYRNTVPVPRHWCQKRKFLQGKRGIEKQPFHLPDFIAATGIEKIRQAYIEKEDSKKLKQKQRERMQPKMGKMDIDYQVLHDAFFKYQTKPKLTTHGDMYHEGKEFEVKLREIKPGILSHDLKEALGMPEGSPPPWLINMQRYGPPPSYPQLKIPGLNAPIPPGASFGYHPGGWGKPPVDEFGRPLYGDVFGVQQQDQHNYEVLEEKEERIAPGTLLGTSHTYVLGTQEKPGPKRVDLLRGQKTDKVDVTIQPEELEVMDDVLAAKYEEAREEEKMRNQKEDFSDMVAEAEKKRKRKMQEKEGKSKKKDFKF